VDAPSLIAQGFGSHSHNHDCYGDILAGTGEDGRLPLATLDLVVHAARPCPCALCAEVLWARASAVVVSFGLFGFVSSSSFQTLLLIRRLLSWGSWDRVPIILFAWCRCRPISREVQHGALPHWVAASHRTGLGVRVAWGRWQEVIDVL
jgi:hypothetical protein